MFRQPYSGPSVRTPASPLSSAADPPTVPATAFALEVSCGAARLAKALRNVGFVVEGTNYHRCRHEPEIPAIRANLSTAAGQHIIWRLVADPRLAFILMAPPCGTASRAREKFVSKSLWRGKVPKPLRSQKHPAGFPGLKPKDKLRVELANRLYALAVQVATECLGRKIPFVIENPKNSYFWDLPEVKQLLEQAGVEDVIYQACMHGGARPKRTQLLGTLPGSRQLALLCDGGHQHEAWGVRRSQGRWHFDTASEAVYPYLLCQRLARLIATAQPPEGRLGAGQAPARAHKTQVVPASTHSSPPAAATWAAAAARQH